jgi:hypothetical protein
MVIAKIKLLRALNIDVKACRNLLKKFGKFDLIRGVEKAISLRIFQNPKNSFACYSKSSRLGLYIKYILYNQDIFDMSKDIFS